MDRSGDIGIFVSLCPVLPNSGFPLQLSVPSSPPSFALIPIKIHTTWLQAIMPKIFDNSRPRLTYPCPCPELSERAADASQPPIHSSTLVNGIFALRILT
jgi:hypothetical protein